MSEGRHHDWRLNTVAGAAPSRYLLELEILAMAEEAMTHVEPRAVGFG